MKRILFTGSSSLLGSKMVELASKQHEVIATYHRHPTGIPSVTSLPLDITDQEQAIRLIVERSPHIVVHTAAWVDADGCEKDREKARRINVEGTRNIALGASLAGACLVYISTSHVFDGTRGKYSEEDKPAPVNYYGTTKLEGERVVQETCRDYIIARLAVFFGWNPVRPDFVARLVSDLTQGKAPPVAKDQYCNPILADSAGKGILTLVEHDARGIFHLGGKECISLLDFARRIAASLQLNGELIREATVARLGLLAPRPKYGCLDTSKMEQLFAFHPPTVEESLLQFKSSHPWPFPFPGMGMSSLKTQN